MKTSGFCFGNISLLSESFENHKTNKYWTLIYARKAAGMYILDDNLVCLNDGDLLYFPPGVGFSFSSDDLGDEYCANIDAVVIRFDETWLDSLLGVFHDLNDEILKIKEARTPAMVSGLKWLSLSSLMNDLSACRDVRRPRLMMEILELVSTRKDMVPIAPAVVPDESVSEKMQKIERYIDCNVYGKITLDDLASYVGMNRTYFCLFFKKHFHRSMTEYINERKVGLSSGMLLGTDKPIGVISAECGFTSVTYFNRIFRKIKGMSPSRYRSEHKNI